MCVHRPLWYKEFHVVTSCSTDQGGDQEWCGWNAKRVESERQAVYRERKVRKKANEAIHNLIEHCSLGWCNREHVESKALNSWKLNIFKIIDGRISFYCNNLDLLPPKPKFTFRHLKKGIQEFHRKFVLAPADKAANNVVVA